MYYNFDMNSQSSKPGIKLTQLSNAQQQQLSNSQQQVPSQQAPLPFQIPQQQQPTFTNVQAAQMQSPLQIPQQQFQQQFYQSNNMQNAKPLIPNAPQSGVGYYGFGTRDLSSPQEQPAIFNDDQVFQESVKEVGSSEGKL